MNPFAIGWDGMGMGRGNHRDVSGALECGGFGERVGKKWQLMERSPFAAPNRKGWLYFRTDTLRFDFEETFSSTTTGRKRGRAADLFKTAGVELRREPGSE